MAEAPQMVPLSLSAPLPEAPPQHPPALRRTRSEIRQLASQESCSPQQRRPHTAAQNRDAWAQLYNTDMLLFENPVHKVGRAMRGKLRCVGAFFPTKNGGESPTEGPGGAQMRWRQNPVHT